MMKLKELKKDIKLIREGSKYVSLFLGRGYMAYEIIVTTIRMVTPYISVYFSGRIITALTDNAAFNTVLKYVLFAMGSTFVLDIITRIINRKRLIMLNSGHYKHEALLSKKSLSLDYGKAESAAVSALRAKVSENRRANGLGVFWVAECVGIITSLMFSLVVAISMISGMFFSYSSKSLTGILKIANSPLFSVLLGIIFVVLIAFTVKANREFAKDEFDAYAYSGTAFPIMDYYSEKVLNENKSGKDIRIFNEKNLIFGELSRTAFNLIRVSRDRIFRSKLKYGSLPVIVSATLGGLVYIFVGLKALSGAFGVGKVVEYYGVITTLLSAISSLVVELNFVKSNNMYLEQELEYLNLESDMENGTRTLADIDLKKLEFEFHNVSFKYPDTDVFVLRGLSLKINCSEHFAVVGMNGSGKTTMIKLLCRLYDPTEGYITVNGIDIREFDSEEFFKLFAVVFQDFKLLAFPIGENVAGSENYDEKKVWDCLEMAGVKERVESFPLKLNQSIYKLYEKEGIDLSGGEEQKIAIARALYKDAPFVILDEPTAALDPIAESEIYSKFNDIVGEKTAVYISHRLSSCRFCDRILVFENGAVIQEGNHDELVKDENGKYYELWNAQAAYYNSRSENEK